MRVVVLVAAMLVAGCGEVTREQTTAADAACAPHGGVQRYDVTVKSSFMAKCVNGLLISGSASLPDPRPK